METIPKIIHYCWFGGKEKPKKIKKCIKSWRKFCPDWEIKEWNEQNFNVNKYRYTQEAYAEKKFAFVSDVCRLEAIVNEGGIYLDTDVELLRPFDEKILSTSGFAGFLTDREVSTGVIGSRRGGNPFFEELLKTYDDDRFIKDGKMDMTTDVKRCTKMISEKGLRLDNSLQTIGSVTVFPKEYFAPKDNETGLLTVTENTYAIHHYACSWTTRRNRWHQFINQKYLRFRIKLKRIFKKK